MYSARMSGVPAVTLSLDRWHTSPVPAVNTGDDALAVLKIYFESAVYTPQVRTIADALNLRKNERIAKWRSVMREWTSRLSTGQITQLEIDEALREANSYLQGAKLMKDIVPTWSVFVTLPISVIKLFFAVRISFLWFRSLYLA
jgi:hypothetical protein